MPQTLNLASVSNNKRWIFLSFDYAFIVSIYEVFIVQVNVKDFAIYQFKAIYL